SVLALASMPARAQDCGATSKATYKECLDRGGSGAANSSLGNADFSYMETCTKQYKSDLAKCGGNQDELSQACREAKIGITWVLKLDAGARRTYESGLQSGMSSLDAVIWAQHHNPHQQQMIRECAASSQMVTSIEGARTVARATPNSPGNPSAGGEEDLSKYVGSLTELSLGNSKTVYVYNKSSSRSIWVAIWLTDCTNVSSCGMKYSGVFLRPGQQFPFSVMPWPDLDTPPSFSVEPIPRDHP
ncbi:MAG: hypothetical protein WAW96_01215, partial [Alphaproteobacteria bacterium]